MQILIPVLPLQRRYHALFVIFVKLVFHFLGRFGFRPCFLFRGLSFLFRPLHQTYIGNVDRPFSFGDFTVRIVLRFAQVPLNDPNALDQYPLLRWQDLKDFAAGSFVVPGNDLDIVALLHVKLGAVHRTSGASDTIFIKFFSRSSRATGPKIRVPRGFKSLSIITIALLSKRRIEPSSRFTGCLVRPRTARTTSPFFTVPVALASFTFAVMTSPMRA